MKFALYITTKYWKKHKKNLAVLIFSAALMTSVILAFWLAEREKTNRVFDDSYSTYGYRDLTVANASDEIREEIVNGNAGIKVGSALVFGEIGDREKFAYGTFDDAHNLFRIPFESGRFPTTKGEIAVDRAVIDRLYWTGKCGGKITLGGEKFTVTGIFDISSRYGSQLAPSVTGSDTEKPTLPLIVFPECTGEPVARQDYFAHVFDRHLTVDEVQSDAEYKRISEYLANTLDWQNQWFFFDFIGSGKVDDVLSGTTKYDANYYSRLFLVGAAVAVLSVFTVLRSVFKERESNILILKNLGMSRKKRALMFAVECGLLAIFQTVVGFICGSSAHLASVGFKTIFLDEKFISGFSIDPFVTSRSIEPFLMSGIVSVCVMILAYVLNILTIKTSRKIPKKNARPRKLSRCFSAIFRGGTTSVVQVVCLALIGCCAAMCYMDSTHAGKYVQSVMMGAPDDTLLAGGIDLEECGVEEYYSCPEPMVFGTINIFNPTCGFYTTENGFSAGIGDDISARLPEYAYAGGTLKQPFIISENPLESFTNQIDFTEEEVRKAIIELSAEEYKNFFDEGQIGSKYLYQAPTRIVEEKTLARLAEYTVDGRIDIEELNSGREILIVSGNSKTTFEAGQSLVFGSTTGSENTFGICGISVSEPVKIGAVIVVTNKADELLKRLVLTDENKMTYNFLTTAAGASAMGLNGARYTEIFSEKEIDGSIIPSSAQMKLVSRNSLRRELVFERIRKAGAAIATILLMSLLGFSAYFNGIGMKIRQKSYEISVLRAQGTSLKSLRRTLAVNSLKIPLTAFGGGYAVLKIMQIFANSLANRWDELVSQNSELIKNIKETGLMRNNWWQANLELPMIVLLLIFTAVTVLLTFAALRKFKGDIASDLNSGRTRQ